MILKGLRKETIILGSFLMISLRTETKMIHPSWKDNAGWLINVSLRSSTLVMVIAQVEAERNKKKGGEKNISSKILISQRRKKAKICKFIGGKPPLD